MILSHRDVSVTFFGLGIGLGLTVTGLSLGLMKFWSRSHTFWSRGLKSIICSSSVMTAEVLTVFCVLLNLISGHYEYFTIEEIVIIIDYSSFVISNSLYNRY